MDKLAKDDYRLLGQLFTRVYFSLFVSFFYYARETYLFDTELWFYHLQVVSWLTFMAIKDRRVIGFVNKIT